MKPTITNVVYKNLDVEMVYNYDSNLWHTIATCKSPYAQFEESYILDNPDLFQFDFIYDKSTVIEQARKEVMSKMEIPDIIKDFVSIKDGKIHVKLTNRKPIVAEEISLIKFRIMACSEKTTNMLKDLKILSDHLATLKKEFQSIESQIKQTLRHD